MPFETLADAVLVVHFAIVVFVVGGLGAIIVGNWLRWQWVNALWFRVAHLVAIGIVVAQAWLGVACPLTTLESWLRVQAGSTAYRQGFIEHWLQRILFYEAPAWAFTSVYTGFALLVLAAWWFFPPRRKRVDGRSPTRSPEQKDASR